jgi:hypothetical protein
LVPKHYIWYYLKMLNDFFIKFKRDIFVITFLIILTGIFLWLVNIRAFRLDDSFFGYTYAKNLLEGNGFTFNGVRVLGTSAPVPVLLYAVVGFILKFLGFTPNIQNIAETLSIFFIFSTVIVIYFLIRNLVKSRFSAFTGALFFVTNILYLRIFGHESLIAIFFVIFASYLALKNRFLMAAIFLSLGFLCRAETIFIWPFILFLIAQHSPTKKDFLKKTLPILALYFTPILAWYGFSYFYFHKLFSNSFSFKIVQAQIAHYSFIRGFASFIKSTYFGSAFGVAAFTLTLIILLPVLWYFSRKFIELMRSKFSKNLSEYNFIVFIFSTVFIPLVFYIFIKITFYHWFLFMPVIGLAVIIGSFRFRFLVFGLIFLQIIISYKVFHPKVDGLAEIYSEVGFYLKENTSADSSIGYIENGLIAYNSERKIIDVTGMVTSGVVEALKDGDKMWVYENYKPDYMILNYPGYADWLINPRAYPEFMKKYKEVKVFELNRMPFLYLYERS